MFVRVEFPRLRTSAREDTMPDELAAARGLSLAEQKKLEFCEKQIATGITNVEAAFKTIRDLRLYREKHTSFDAYCREVWKLTRRTVDRRIKFELAVADAETHGSQPPANERQARQQTTKPIEIIRVPPSRSGEVTMKSIPLTTPEPEIEDGEWEPVNRQAVNAATLGLWIDGVLDHEDRITIGMHELLDSGQLNPTDKQMVAEALALLRDRLDAALVAFLPSEPNASPI